MANSRTCQTCDKAILKSEGGNLLMNTHCSRFCYELEKQGIVHEPIKPAPGRPAKPVIVITNCVFCGAKTKLSLRRPNAWLCGQECNILKSQMFGRKSNKKYLVFLCLQLHGPQTATQIATMLGQIHNRYRFNHSTICQMLRTYVVRGKVIKHPDPLNDKNGATYEIEHNLPLINLVPPSLSR